MADNTIDTLDIQIKSSTARAVKALGDLESKLSGLNRVFGNLNTGGLRNYSRELGRATVAASTLSKIKITTPSLGGLTKEFGKLSKIDLSGLSGVKENLTNLSDGLKELNKIDLSSVESNKIKELSIAVSKLRDLKVPDLSGFSNELRELASVDIKSSGINNTINAIKRLATADIGKLNPIKIAMIGSSLKSLARVPDVSSNLNRFVSSFARVAQAGEKTGQAASGFADLGRQVRKAVTNLSGVGEISESLNLFIQSIGRLASAGSKAGQTAGGLKSLAAETRGFFEVMKNAPKISENTIQMTQALAQLASAGGRVNTSANTISSSFSKLSTSGKVAKASFNVLVKTTKFAASQIMKLAGKITSAFKSITSSSHGLRTASLNMGTLLKTALGFRAVQGLWNFGKTAIEAGSNVSEVQNIVDTAFGSMSGMVDEFASTAIEKFGLSELAAKKYAGTMMAMLNSTGVAKDAAAEMSITLAGLAGDLASFYNISADEAFTAIRAGISGETEPLKRFGINMNIANINAYALANGLHKTYNEMTLSEQAMIRYNYIMAATSQQQGDFARTSGSWANQVRTLTENYRRLSSIIGQGLIAAILPAVQALNALMEKLIQVAKVFRNFILALTGKNIKDVQSASGSKDTYMGLENLGAAGGDAASGMDDATDSAQKLKKALSVLSFDELNQLSESASSAGGALSGIGGSGLDNIQTPGFGELSDAVNEASKNGEKNISLFAHRIRKAILSENWQALGIVLAQELNKGLQKVYDVISWENVGPKITAFTTAFTQTFNSLVEHFDWDLLGRTVGAGVNTIVNSLNQLADGIDWVNLGSKMAEGINGLFDEIDWYNLGHLIGNKFRIAWDMFAGFVKDLDYAEIGRSVAEFLTGAFNTTPFGEIGTALSNLIDGAFEALKNFTAEFEWGDFANNVSEGISNFLKDTEWKENGEVLGSFLLNLVNALKSVLTKDTFYDFGKAVGEFLGGLPWLELLKSAAELIIGGLGSALKGLFESGLEGTITAGISGAFIAVKVANITGLSSLAKLVVSHFSKKFETDQAIKKLADALGKTLSSSATTASTALDTAEAAAGKAAKGGFKSLLGKIKSLGTHAGNVASGGLKSLLSAIGSSGAGIGLIAAVPVATEVLAKFVEKLMGGNGKLSDMGGAVNDLAGRLQNLGTITDVQADEIREMIDSYEDSGKSAQEMVDGIIAKFSEWGLSTEEVNMVLQNNEFYTSKTAESMDLLTQGITQLGTGFSQTADQINLSGVSASEAWSAMRSSLDELSVSGSQFDEQYKGVLQALDMSGMSSENAQAALDAVVMALEAAGIPTDEFIQLMREKFPEAFISAKQSAEVNMDGTQKAISNNMETAKENAKQSAKEIANSANENFSQVDSDAKKAFGNVSESSETDWASSYDSVNEALNKMKGATSEKMRQIFKNVESYTKSIWNITANNWDAISSKVSNVLGDMNQKISQELNVIASEFSNLGNRISNSIGDLYTIGQNAAQSFANGFQSIHIPTPQLYISSWDTHQLGEGKYFQTPNFSLNWYKKGGLFNNASVIGVGEAGKEAVLPLENRRTMSMIADSILSNSKSMGMDEKVLTNAVARGVAMAMMNNQQSPINVTCYAELRTEDNEVLARAVTKGQQSLDYRMHPTPQF